MTTVLWDVKTRTREKHHPIANTQIARFQVVRDERLEPSTSARPTTEFLRSTWFAMFPFAPVRLRRRRKGGGGYPGRSGTVPCDLGAPPAAAAITTPAMPGGSWPTSPDDRRSVSHRRPTSPGMSVLHCYSFPLLHLRQHRLNLHPLPEGERKQGTKTSVSVHTGAIAHTGQSRRRSSQGRRCGAAQKARDGKRCRDALCLLF